MSAWFAVAGGWTLLVSGVAHLARPGDLRATVHAQSLVPVGLVPLVAVAAPPVEVVLGTAVLWAAAVSTAWWTPATAVAGGLLAAYGGYLGLLARRGVTGDCGCGPVPDAVGAYTVARPVVLAAGLVAAAIVGPAGLTALVDTVGRPLLLGSAATGAVVGLTAHAGRAHSDRAMAALRAEFAWQVADELDELDA